MRTIAIIQARMTSRRLPGKVMMNLGGKPVLQVVLERAARIIGIDDLVCALPAKVESGTMMALLNRLNVPCVLGPEDDVLARYDAAAEAFKADVIVRITADCPLLDAEVCSQIIALRKFKGADYASNVHPRSYPKGLDCECFTTGVLKRAMSHATEAYDREHVTPWIVRNTARTNLASGRFDLAHRRWTLDTIEDYEFLQKIFQAGDPQTMTDVLAILERNPAIQRPHKLLRDVA